MGALAAIQEPGSRAACVRVIVNPRCGNRRARRRIASIRRLMASRGLEGDVIETTAPGEAARLAREAPPETDAVIVVGGDGTLNEVVNGGAGRDLPVGILPLGTSNILARELGISDDVRRLLDSLSAGRTLSIDSLLANGHRVLSTFSVGCDSLVCKEFHDTRGARAVSILSYVRPLVRVVSRFEYRPLSVRVDGRLVTAAAAHVMVGNTSRYGGPFRFTHRADPADGLMDVIVYMGRTRRDLLKYLWGGLCGDMSAYRDARSMRAREVRIEGPADFPYQVDGDPAGTLPVRVRIDPASVRVLVP